MSTAIDIVKELMNRNYGGFREDHFNEIAEAKVKDILEDQWIKVEDGLPEESESVWYRIWLSEVFTNIPLETHARYFQNNWWRRNNPASLITGRVTRWQPIIPPK